MARESDLGSIISTVAIALLVGGTAPWWWNALHRPPQNSDSSINRLSPNGPAAAVPSPTEPSPTRPSPEDNPVVEGGPIEVRCSVNPNVLAPGAATELLIQTISSRQTPVPGANVKIDAGGGLFSASGGLSVLGITDAAGTFRTLWRAPAPAAPGYGFNVTVSKQDFTDGSGGCTAIVQ